MMENSPGGKQMADAMKKMMGEGVNSWFGSDGKVYVQVTAKDWEAARRQLDEYLDGDRRHRAKQGVPGDMETATVRDNRRRPDGFAAVRGGHCRLHRPRVAGAGTPLQYPAPEGAQGEGLFRHGSCLQPTRGSLEIWLPGTGSTKSSRWSSRSAGAGNEQ